MATRATRSSARVAAQSEIPASDASPPVPARRKRKATDGDGAAPTTPTKKSSRASKKIEKAPDPAIALMTEPVHGGPPETPKPRAVSRLLEPNASHATIVSPETFRVIKSQPSDPDASPTKATLTKTQPTDNVLETACQHLISVDPRMKPLIEKHHCQIFSPEGLADKIDPFESLVSSMISQLISGAGARTVKARFVRLFADSPDSDSPPFPRPSQVSAASIPTIQSAGIAQRKAEWIKNLADKFVSGELGAQMMAEAPYPELHKTLLALPGLGEWSVEMFACFALKRLDVFSVGDLGVQRGMAAFAGRDVARLRNKGGKWKYMSKKEMEETAAKFAPYRSVFMWYMWRVEETDVSTLE